MTRNEGNACPKCGGELRCYTGYRPPLYQCRGCGVFFGDLELKEACKSAAKDARIAELEATINACYTTQDNLRAELAAAQDAAKALEGLRQLGDAYELRYTGLENDPEWTVYENKSNKDYRPFYADTPLAAVNAALAAKEEK